MSKKTLSLFASMAIGLAAAGPLQADLTATAVLTLDNLLFLDSGGIYWTLTTISSKGP